MKLPSENIEISINHDKTALLWNLARWMKGTGLIIIVFGLIYCLAVLATEGSFIGAILTLGMGIFIVFIGTRLTAASGFISQLIHTGDQANLMQALENMRQFFKYSGIALIVITVMVIITMIAISVLGLPFQELGVQ